MALRKRGVTFLICFGKRGYPEKEGGGATAKLQEPGWGHIHRREIEFRQSSRGGGGGGDALL